MSKARQKGTLAESALVKYLRGHGWPSAERRALHGNLDLGDITGTPGLAWEVKNHRTYKFPEWIAETKEEKENAGADYGILVIKPNGVGITTEKVAQWWAMLTVEQLTNLLRDAGYGTPRD